MESSKLFLLLIGMCCVTLVRQAHAECCFIFEKVTFGMENGICEMVGGHGGNICEVNICGDGVARKGAYCGQGPCNIFGCNCDDGCLTGEWSESFKEKNQHHGIKIYETFNKIF
ncbi:hypothetical protein KR054_007490 [Drosophila jambulina]|nr:hypothetical protein KR054_007490 [Drosophila jambulina]